jgi:hypothetical protein
MATAGLGRYHASSFGPTSSLRQNQGCFRDSRLWLHQPPNAKRGTLHFPAVSDQRPLFDALITVTAGQSRSTSRPPLEGLRWGAYFVVFQVLFVIINWLLASPNLAITLFYEL